MSRYSDNFSSYVNFLNKYFRYDLSSFNIEKDKVILEVGSGFGDRILSLKEQGYHNIMGIEIDEEMVNNSKVDCIKHGSIEDISFESESFDIVFVENVFHHIENYEVALKEIHRVLKKDGSLCFIEPRNSIYRKLLDFITFKTPVPKIFKGPWKLRHEVMSEEIETGMYPLWLESSGKFESLLGHLFQKKMEQKTMWFTLCRAEKS